MMNKEELLKRYHAACHAMQSGVAYLMNSGVNMKGPSKETEPKHLRVGINVAMCDHAALVGILVKKGLITEHEYYLAMAEQMEAEVKLYEDRIGLPGVKLG